jgi:hypothetical protein
VAQGIGPEFNPHNTKKKKKKVSLRTWWKKKNLQYSIRRR